jgi:hypothetical protein
MLAFIARALDEPSGHATDQPCFSAFLAFLHARHRTFPCGRLRCQGDRQRDDSVLHFSRQPVELGVVHGALGPCVKSRSWCGETSRRPGLKILFSTFPKSFILRRGGVFA